MTKNILLLNFPTEIKHNWGCTASCEGLKKLLVSLFPKSNFRNHPIHFKVPKAKIPRSPSLFDTYTDYLAGIGWKEYSDMEWADLVILDGEGSIHEFDNPNTNDFVYLKLLSIYAAKIKYKKKTMIINHTLDFSSQEFRAFVTTVYPTCDYISVREPKSKKMLDALGIASCLTADTAFLYDHSKNPHKDLKVHNELPDRYYVFFISQLVTTTPDYFIDLCRQIWKEFKLPPVFFILSEKEKNIINAIKHSGIPFCSIEQFIEPSLLIKALEKAEFCLSGRFHATIFSALANTPFIGFRSNTFKVAGLIELLKYPFPEMVFAETATNKIIQNVKELLKTRESLKQTLFNHVQKAKDLAVKTNVIAM